LATRAGADSSRVQSLLDRERCQRWGRHPLSIRENAASSSVAQGFPLETAWSAMCRQATTIVGKQSGAVGGNFVGTISERHRLERGRLEGKPKKTGKIERTEKRTPAPSNIEKRAA